MKTINEIKTKRLLLRPLCIDDLYAVNDYSTNIDNTKYLTSPNHNLEETKDYLAWVADEWNQNSPKYYGFAIIFDNKLIGEIAFGGESGTSEVSMGWVIHRDFWHCGYASEAAIAVIDLLFNAMGVDKITAACDIKNVASCRLMEKLGMQIESENESWEYEDGRVSKAASYFIQKHTL